jgi:hypothetical protein
VAERPDKTNDRSRTADPLLRSVVIRDTAIDLRRSLRPVAWLVLEELALCAIEVEGGLVAAASARTIATRLGLDPATTAVALRTLRERGLVELTRALGPSGRFGLSVYRLVHLPGVEVRAPRGDTPHTTTPPTGESDAATPYPRRRRPPPVHASNGDAQGTFDLGSGRR